MCFMLAVFLVLAMFFIKSIRRSIKKRKQANLKTHLPAIIYTLTLVLCYLVPGSESFESDAMIVAGHQDTENQDIIKFRKNKTFEMNSTAVLGYNEWFTGTYAQKGDTLLLAYGSSKPSNLGSKLLRTNNELITIDRRDSIYCCPSVRVHKRKIYCCPAFHIYKSPQ